MPQFRNILNRKPAASDGSEDSNDTSQTQKSSQLLNSTNSGPLNFRNSREEVSNEYKLSVVNDSGVYLPPSPPEKRSFWSRTSNSKATTNHRNLVDENEPFSISRESFDSYRRSFDISAKSPIQYADNVQSRASLDSSRFSRLGERPAIKSQTFVKPQSMEEEAFEDVGLADEEAKPKKRGLFSRFGDNSSETAATANNSNNNNNRPSSSHLGFRLPGRKRGQSGQGAELANYKQEAPSTEV
ncbi:hypothetical protein UA08_04477 [Talaromyces atroroseus]|uniref:Uncharacterized protein n=1 Tax=Talaromyces atroroseus TaxID=1441469 RepID=A0A225AEZ0_TALAT|nr:hypothetical protein UA08_04477 [Talaromyces atroroseus]OKL59861.1 hypothetical protein UA08_04477 [Talaromyces atroroseus]